MTEKTEKDGSLRLQRQQPSSRRRAAADASRFIQLMARSYSRKSPPLVSEEAKGAHLSMMSASALDEKEEVAEKWTK